ncbi:hypothetical protein GCM10020001_025330 [Nonomuraea salmonea]
MLGGERLEVGDGLGVQPQPQPRVGVALAGDQAQLGQPVDLGLRPRLVGEVGVGGAAPQPERLLQAASGGLRIALFEVLAGRAHELLEPERVDLVGRHAQRVAGRDRHQQPVGAAARTARLQHPAQARDVDLQARLRAFCRVVVPQIVKKCVNGHDLTSGHEQAGQDGPLSQPAEVEFVVVFVRLDWPQNSERHHVSRHAMRAYESRTRAVVD